MLAIRPPYLLAIATALTLLAPAVAKLRTHRHELTADEIIAASLDAQGGCARITRMRELTTTGRLVHETGETAVLTLWTQAPRNMRMVVTWSDNVDYDVQVRDDEVTIDQGVVGGIRDHQVVTGTEHEQYLIDASWVCDPEVHPYTSSKLLGITDFEGTRAYQIERMTASGITRTAYIAVDTLLPVGEDRDSVTERVSWEPPGPPHLARLRFSFSDYRDVNGVLIAFQSRQSVLEGDGFFDENTFYVERVSVAATSNR
jgi:hypothetical protein